MWIFRAWITAKDGTRITLTCSAMFPAANGNSVARMTGFYIPMS